MTATSFPRWRRAWIRYGVAAACLLLSIVAALVVMGLFMSGGCE